MRQNVARVVAILNDVLEYKSVIGMQLCQDEYMSK